jgi:hypothetical protein
MIKSQLADMAERLSGVLRHDADGSFQEAKSPLDRL